MSRRPSAPSLARALGVILLLATLAVLAAGVARAADRPTRASRNQPQRRPSSSPAGAPTEEHIVKDPRQMAEQLIGILAKQKSPWQLYDNYANVYNEFAAREAAESPSSKRAEAYQARLVEHLQQMGGVLQQMGECAKTRSDIRLGASEIPFRQRQNEFSKATVQHADLLKQFGRMAAMLPKSKAPPAPNPAPTTTAPIPRH